MGVRQAATILFPDSMDNLSEKAGKFKLAHGGTYNMHSLIRGVLIQSCLAGAKNFTNYVFCHP